MKRSGFILFAAIMALTALIVPISTGMAAEKVYINGIDANFPPFAYMDENGKPSGFDVESLDWIAKEMGFKVEYRAIAWDGIIPSLLARKIDMVYSGMTASPERRRVVTFSDVYWNVNLALAVREDSGLNIVTALDGKRTIGVQSGTTAQMWLEDNLVKKGLLSRERVKIYDNHPLAIRDMLNGRIDSVMQDDVAMEEAVRGKPLVICGWINSGQQFAVATRNDDQELRDILNEGMKRLKASPKWEELVEKYELR